MRSVFVALAIASVALSSSATAQCACLCVDGKMKAICKSATDIQPVCPQFGCSGALGSETQPEAASPLSSTTQRAAYCMGVLGVLVSMQPDDKNSGQRLTRYDRYIKGELARLIMSSNQDNMTIAMLIKKIQNYGKKDAEDSKPIFASTEYAQCKSRCGRTEPQCFVDCVDAFDVTASKVLGCQVLPDRLPY